MCIINGIYPIRSLQSTAWPNYIPSVHLYSARELIKLPGEPTPYGRLSTGLTGGQVALQTRLIIVTSINNAPAADIAAEIIVDLFLGWYKENPCNNDVPMYIVAFLKHQKGEQCPKATILHIQYIPITIYISGKYCLVVF